MQSFTLPDDGRRISRNLISLNILVHELFFAVWLTNERRLAIFPAGTIVRDPHYLEAPIRRQRYLTRRQQYLGFVEWSCDMINLLYYSVTYYSHDVINVLYYEHWTDKQKYFYIWSRGFTVFENGIPKSLLSNSNAVNTYEDKKRRQICQY